MTMEKAANWTKAASAAALLSVLPLAAVIIGCGTARLGDSQEPSVSEDTPTAAAAPIRVGWMLVLRDGDLNLLAAQWERRVTHTGDYLTGALTRDGKVIGLRRADDGGSSLVRLEIGDNSVTKTAEFALDLELPDRVLRAGYLVVSPDDEHVLVDGHLLIGLNSGRRSALAPGGCCEVWSPDGGHIAYLVLAGDWDPDSETVRRRDLWVADIGGGGVPRRLATGLMDWFDIYGRDAESIAWSKDGAEILALSADGAERIERRGSSYEMSGPVNNRLVSVDVETGEARVLASSVDLHRRLKQEGDLLADEVVVSAAATPRDGGPAAFVVMDYERVYGIGLLSDDGRIDRLVVETAPGRNTVRMGAPVWSADGARVAYFGWYMTIQTPFIDVLDVATGAIDRVWTSTEYRKPGHWDLSPDGKWVWIVVSTYHPENPRSTKDLSMLASVDRPGHVELVDGIVLDWCCVRSGEVRAP